MNGAAGFAGRSIHEDILPTRGRDAVEPRRVSGRNLHVRVDGRLHRLDDPI